MKCLVCDTYSQHWAKFLILNIRNDIKSVNLMLMLMLWLWLFN